ncbi:heparinase II/III family protein [Coprinopsis cinerea AmutBmut pab1-1]|nr:heparinase II/III family protein [Coprinopsis cinerea AmutBmut pab1-1]
MSYNTPYKEVGFSDSSTGFIQPPQPPVPRTHKKRISPWIKFGVPALIVIAIAAIVGGVLGSRKKSSDKNDDGNSEDSTDGGKDKNTDSGSLPGIATVTDKLEAGRFATATNSKYMIPVYPSATNAALFSAPTFDANAATWPQDPEQFGEPSPLQVRHDRPRLIAPAYKWEALPDLIRADPYLAGWNETIFRNASDYHALPPVRYHMDGYSGILDNAREFKMRIKAFAYAWRLSQNTRWADRAWQEIQHVVSDDFGGPDPDNTKWHPTHFLDTAEFSAAFGIAYDWMYDFWTPEQRTFIRDNLIRLGLSHGVAVYGEGADFGWWSRDTTGNWNCVCNGGLTLGALAILGDDTTGTAEALLRAAIDNAKANCIRAVTDDGSWQESTNYWYFGTTGLAEMASALLSATGSHYGLLTENENYWRTGTFHMYVFGPTSLFDFGDHGPNKFSTTANTMFLLGDQLDHPEFILHQREQADAAEPWSMFWYNPAVAGAFWSGLPLDHFFDSPPVQWASMRSSWTDKDAAFLGIKAGRNQGHQRHNDLDVGTFVIDALGTRWAGELGSGDYLSTEYFGGEDQDAERWKYYRKHTMGQNTLMIGRRNQNVDAAPTVRHDSSGTTQDSSTVFTPEDDSTAFWTTDMTSAYFDATSVKRGGRFLNGRRQILIQDEVDAQAEVQWRMHTNATIEIDSSGTSATLTLDGKEMQVVLLDPPAGARFSEQPAERQGIEPIPAFGDQSNDGVRVLSIVLDAGSYTLRVLFNPQWEGMGADDYVTPPNVALDDWSLTSHN